ncbi:MAG: hypothetical protein Q7R96_04255 [Nanoarchaeota archaeon]|nr:hypothetical protein [Nanoarchaeota archaeon]
MLFKRPKNPQEITIVRESLEEIARKKQLEEDIQRMFEENKKLNDQLRKDPHRYVDELNGYFFYHLERLEQVLPITISAITFSTQTHPETFLQQRKSHIIDRNEDNVIQHTLDFPDWLPLKKGDTLKANIFTGKFWPFYAEYEGSFEKRIGEHTLTREQIYQQLLDERRRFRTRHGLGFDLKKSTRLFLENTYGLWIKTEPNPVETPYRLVLQDGSTYENLDHPYFKIKRRVEQLDRYPDQDD